MTETIAHVGYRPESVPETAAKAQPNPAAEPPAATAPPIADDTPAARRIGLGRRACAARSQQALRLALPESDRDVRRRFTHPLFLPVTAPLRADPRFAGIVQDIGLAAHWARSDRLRDYLSDGSITSSRRS